MFISAIPVLWLFPTFPRPCRQKTTALQLIPPATQASPYLSLYTPFIWLSIRQTSITLRRTFSAGPGGVCLIRGESWLRLFKFFDWLRITIKHNKRPTSVSRYCDGFTENTYSSKSCSAVVYLTFKGLLKRFLEIILCLYSMRRQENAEQ